MFVFVGDGRAMVDTGGGTSESVSRAPRPRRSAPCSWDPASMVARVSFACQSAATAMAVHGSGGRVRMAAETDLYGRRDALPAGICMAAKARAADNQIVAHLAAVVSGHQGEPTDAWTCFFERRYDRTEADPTPVRDARAG